MAYYLPWLKNTPPASNDWPNGTVNASSASQTDVNTALASASAGQTVVIPSGSATWSGDTTIPAGVRLKGDGGGWIQGSSTSSVAVGTGTKSFTIRTSAKLDAGTSAIFGFTNGETILARLKYDASVTMTGTVSSWDGTTLVMSVSSTSGSGTYDRWNFQKRGTTLITRTGGTISLSSHATYKSALCDVEITNSTNTGDELLGVSGNASNALIELTRVQVVCSTHFGGSASRLMVGTSKGWIMTRCSVAFDGFNWGVLGASPAYGIKTVNSAAAPTDDWSTGPYYGTDDDNGKRNFYIEDCYFVGGSSEAYDFDGGSRAVVRQCVQDNCSGGSHGKDTSNESMRQIQQYNNLWIFENNGFSDNTNACDTYFYHRGGPGVWTDCEVDDITSGQWGNKAQWRYTIQAIRRNTALSCPTTYPISQQIGQGCNGSGTPTTEGFYHWNNTGSGNFPTSDDYNPDDCGNGLTTDDFVITDRDIFASAKPSFTKYTYPHPLRMT